MSLYPIKFEPIRKPTIWGEEVWLLSSLNGVESIVINGNHKGKNIVDLVRLYGEELVGIKYKEYGDIFPILIKIINAKDDLSIQVHPNNNMAIREHGCFGKSEMWYVLDNNNGTANLISGLNEHLSLDEYEKRVDNHTIINALVSHKVEIGDVFYIPAGRIHSIGAGCSILEIQQSSDITYRIYDYGRKDMYGRYRELHTDLAKCAIDFNVYSEYKTIYEKDSECRVLQSPLFSVNILKQKGDRCIDYSHTNSFISLFCIDGEASIIDNKGYSINITQGEAVLIPACCDYIIVKSEHVRFIECYI